MSVAIKFESHAKCAPRATSATGGSAGSPLERVIEMNRDLREKLILFRTHGLPTDPKLAAHLRVYEAITDALGDLLLAEAPLLDAQSGAQQELAAMEARLQRTLARKPGAAKEPILSPEAVKDGWVQDGRLISADELGRHWNKRSRQALEQACSRGELFALKIKNRRWYPADFAGLTVDAVKAVCLALRGVDPVSSFVFWQRPHGALGGKNITQALLEQHVDDAVRLARAFADDYSGNAAST